MSEQSVLDQIPPEKQSLVRRFVARLEAVAGVQAIALGGSFARGVAQPYSDIDLVLYYREAAPFRPAELGVAVATLTLNVPQLTDFYGWGPWVNGGGWLDTAQGRVDLLYRNLDQIERVISAAAEGKIAHDYFQQPTFGYHSTTYLAETFDGLPLADPHRELQRLRESVSAYPPKLKLTSVRSALLSAEFDLVHAVKFAERTDVLGTVGCCARITYHFLLCWFALNERYYPGEKGALVLLESLPTKPVGAVRRLKGVLATSAHSAA
ncbi:MAG: nucleotidyltransferase domain-containing protein [Verrucomicrobia bacterium]|nr:nucleotidyltransferase domain-containing protein [Verrucomicrobiota bacterium]